MNLVIKFCLLVIFYCMKQYYSYYNTIILIHCLLPRIVVCFEVICMNLCYGHENVGCLKIVFIMLL